MNLLSQKIKYRVVIICIVVTFHRLVRDVDASDGLVIANKLEQCSSMVNVFQAKAAALRAVILGAPGSGKGTISARIVKSFGVMHISTGDKLRDHVARNTHVGEEVKKYLNEGSLVPDNTMIALVNHEIEAVSNKNYLLDGFPRTRVQAEKLQSLHPVNLVLNLIVPHDAIIGRVKNRWVHLPSGRVYNIGFNDPKVPGKDDVTGEPLSQRIDDQPQVVAKRLREYTSQTEPVIEYYRKLGFLRDFQGNRTDEIWPGIKSVIEEFLKQEQHKAQ